MLTVDSLKVISAAHQATAEQVDRLAAVAQSGTYEDLFRLIGTHLNFERGVANLLRQKFPGERLLDIVDGCDFNVIESQFSLSPSRIRLRAAEIDLDVAKLSGDVEAINTSYHALTAVRREMIQSALEQR